MKRIFPYFVVLLIVVAIFNACTQKPLFPLEPKIEFVSISKNQVNQGDTLWIKLNFEDGDGNLGKEVNSAATCKTNCEFVTDSSCFLDPFFGAFLIDMRDSCFQYLDLPDFEPDGKIKAVSGELFLNVPPIFCKNFGCPTCQTDKLVYKVIVKDIEQNYSNTVLTDTIYINCN